jgi:hypothetical protein
MQAKSPDAVLGQVLVDVLDSGILRVRSYVDGKCDSAGHFIPAEAGQAMTAAVQEVRDAVAQQLEASLQVEAAATEARPMRSACAGFLPFDPSSRPGYEYRNINPLRALSEGELVLPAAEADGLEAKFNAWRAGRKFFVSE